MIETGFNKINEVTGKDKRMHLQKTVWNTLNIQDIVDPIQQGTYRRFYQSFTNINRKGNQHVLQCTYAVCAPSTSEQQLSIFVAVSSCDKETK